MSRHPAFDKLIRLLKELFQLDQPDLDFGLYRIMHARAGEISRFLDRDLLPQVQAAFSRFQAVDRAGLEKELARVIKQANHLGVDPESSPKVQELRQKIAEQGVDVTGMALEVYDHLYKFFRRYYHEGDFLAKRVYKPGVYAIPYEGEEVKLHWANRDQYYIKTSEHLRDYAFALKPGATDDPMRVHFRLKDAAEGEHGNIKAGEDQNRVFILAKQDCLIEQDGESGRELVICFEYRPATLADWSETAREKATEAARKKPPGQQVLREDAVRRILAMDDASFKHWVAELARPHIKATGEPAGYSRLAAHLNRYTARNTFDYFIHKDLDGFLRRELDFYIKTEVMHLDDIESETAPRVEQYLSRIKIIRQIAGKIIDFLAQLENFQKKLWLKKKFVTDTSWCIRVGCIPEAFFPAIAANDPQREEWVRLLAIDEIHKNIFAADYSEPLTPAFLKAHPTLMVDTRHFDDGFTLQLLEAVGDIDGQTDGVLIHSENYQALSLMQECFQRKIKCVYIDPPYNTSNDNFVYKDHYQHSSWLSFINDRIHLSLNLLKMDGVLFSHIDDNELFHYKQILDDILGRENFLCTFSWQKRYAPPPDTKDIGYTHEAILAYRRSENFERNLLPFTNDQKGRYKNSDNDPRGPWKSMDYTCRYTASERPNLYYPITNPNTGEQIWPKKSRVWAFSIGEHERNEREDRIWWGKTGKNRVPALKNYIADIQEGFMPTTLLQHESVGHTDEAAKELRCLFPDIKATPKPTRLGIHLIRIGGSNAGYVCDFFSGTGTTGHAIINFNRDDGGQRKFILAEMGDYFDTVLVPRLKKVTFSPEWKTGRPKRLATPEEAQRSPRIMKVIRLESYEDTLNNLALCRDEAQASLLNFAEAQGPGGLREQYLLRYLLDVETRGSRSLLNIDDFTDPTAYRLKVRRPGSEETREVNVDLVETFNWLLGLTVEAIAAPRTVTAEFTRDTDPDLPNEAPRRLLLDGDVQEDPNGPWWFRTVVGTTPDGRRTLVIWRKLTGNAEKDNLVLDEWVKQQGYAGRDSRFDLICVNGDNHLENLGRPGDTRAVRLIEEEFHRLMFEVPGA